MKPYLHFLKSLSMLITRWFRKKNLIYGLQVKILTFLTWNYFLSLELSLQFEFLGH